MELETVCQSDTAMSLIYAESDFVFLLHKNIDDLSEAACYSSSFSLLRWKHWRAGMYFQIVLALSLQSRIPNTECVNDSCSLPKSWSQFFID